MGQAHCALQPWSVQVDIVVSFFFWVAPCQVDTRGPAMGSGDPGRVPWWSLTEVAGLQHLLLHQVLHND